MLKSIGRERHRSCKSTGCIQQSAFEHGFWNTAKLLKCVQIELYYQQTVSLLISLSPLISIIMRVHKSTIHDSLELICCDATQPVECPWPWPGRLVHLQWFPDGPGGLRFFAQFGYDRPYRAPRAFHKVPHGHSFLLCIGLCMMGV